MRYLLLIYGNDEDWTECPEEELAPRLAEHETFSEDLKNAGALVAAEALQPSSVVTTIRINGGHRLLSDGPFLENREQVSGFYLIEAADLDQALSWGERLARFEENAIEVWPAIDL